MDPSIEVAATPDWGKVSADDDVNPRGVFIGGDKAKIWISHGRLSRPPATAMLNLRGRLLSAIALAVICDHVLGLRTKPRVSINSSASMPAAGEPDVPDVVHSRLDTSHTGLQTVMISEISSPDPPQLEVLPGGDVSLL